MLKISAHACECVKHKLNRNHQSLAHLASTIFISGKFIKLYCAFQ